jgi:hypothetical protein
MRDNNEEMVQLLGAMQLEPNVYACQAQIIINESPVRVQFGINQYEFVLLKKIVTARPLTSLMLSDYRFYFAGSYRMNDSTGKAALAIRIEQGTQNKQFWFEITEKVIANLRWLEGIEAIDEVAHLLY